MAPPATSAEPDLNALKELARVLGLAQNGEVGELVCPRCLRDTLKAIWRGDTVSLYCRHCEFEHAGELPRDKKLLARLVAAFSR